MSFYQEASYMSPGGTQAVLHDIHHCDVLTFHLGERVLTNKKLHISACGSCKCKWRSHSVTLGVDNWALVLPTGSIPSPPGHRHICSANTRRSTNVGLMLVQRLRRWTNIKPISVKCIVFAVRVQRHSLKYRWLFAKYTSLWRNRDIMCTFWL